MSRSIVLQRTGLGDITSVVTSATALSSSANALATYLKSYAPNCSSVSQVQAFQQQYNSTVVTAGLAGALRTDGLYDTATQTALQSVLTVSSVGTTAPAAATCSSASQSLAAAEGALGGGTTGKLVLAGIGLAVVGGVGYLIYRSEHKGRRRNPVNRRVSPGFDYKTGEKLTTRSDYSTLYRNYYAALDLGNRKKAIVIARIIDAKSRGQVARKGPRTA